MVTAWTTMGGQWQALVAHVKDGELRPATLPAGLLTPR